MKIVFIGAVEFSARALERLIDIQADVVGVCTLEKSKVNADHRDLKPIAESASIPVRYTPDINSDETYTWITSLQPDVVFCFGWSRLLKSRLLQLAPLGVIGFHPTALPANRGRHPLIWALVLGLQETASTFFFMDEGADSGDILSQQKIPISEVDDAGTLCERLATIALEQISAFVPKLENGNFQRFEQCHAQANIWRKRERFDGQIDWRMSAQTIHNLVRGLTRPYVGAHFIRNGHEYKVWKSEVGKLSGIQNIEPGKVIRVDGDMFLVKCGDQCIRLLEVEPVPVLAVGEYL